MCLEPLEPSDLATTTTTSRQYSFVLLIMWSLCSAFDWIAWWNDAKPKRLFWGWHHGILINVSLFSAFGGNPLIYQIFFTIIFHSTFCGFCARIPLNVTKYHWKENHGEIGCLLKKPSSNYPVRQNTKSTPHYSSQILQNFHATEFLCFA